MVVCKCAVVVLGRLETPHISVLWYNIGMRTLVLLAVSTVVTLGLSAAPKQTGGRAPIVRDWENIAVNSFNRMPAATYAMPP